MFDPLKHSSGKWDKSKDAGGDAVCRILLIYSRDGADTADEIAPRLQGMEHEVSKRSSFESKFRL